MLWNCSERVSWTVYSEALMAARNYPLFWLTAIVVDTSFANPSF